jgi:hypothetical protein
LNVKTIARQIFREKEKVGHASIQSDLPVFRQ